MINLLLASAYQNVNSTPIFSSQMQLGDFILLTISLIVLAAGIFSIGFILWGGLLLILSGGKEEKIKPAINSIRYSLLGLVMIVISIFIFPKLAGLLGLDVNQYGSPDKIFSTIQDIGTKVLGNSTDNTTTGIEEIDGLPDGFIDDL